MTSRRRALVVAALAPVTVAACAGILGYDDLSARNPVADATPETAETGPDADADVVVDGGPTHASAPSRPTGAAVPSGKGKVVWLAVKRFLLGTQSASGTADRNAWKTLGFDLDGVCTGTRESTENTGTCLRPPGAGSLSLVDGDDCRDNNFGSQLVGFLSFASSDFEQTGNDAILAGRTTWVFRIEDLDDGADDPYAPGALYKTTYTDPAKPPKFDGTDVREVDLESVDAGDVSQPKLLFPKGYMRNGTWVSGEPASFSVVVPLSGVTAFVPLESGVIAFSLDTARASGVGTVAGAIAGDKLESVVRPVAEFAGMCRDSPMYGTIISKLKEFPDVVVGAPNLQDLTKTCDGVTLGMGIQLAAIQPVKTAGPGPVLPSKCDAGVDAGDSGTDASDGARD